MELAMVQHVWIYWSRRYLNLNDPLRPEIRIHCSCLLAMRNGTSSET